MSERVYLDWNATAPLRAEARDAMLAAMDLVGNPSSVHAEGRAAKAVVERARAQVAAAAGCAPDRVVFTSGATEAAALAAANLPALSGGAIEHDAIFAHLKTILAIDTDGLVQTDAAPDALALQVANSETGVIQPRPAQPVALQDAAQAFGRIAWRASDTGYAIIAGHKLGGPKGVGAAILPDGVEIAPLTPGGGQESRRRAGTENVIGVAGFGAAAEAAARDLALGAWMRVENLRDRIEARISETSPHTIFAGRGARRLPNTSCFATPGWKGETQVMQLDLAGISVSAGSACSSGKVGRSRALSAMGLDDDMAASAIRVSLGPATTTDAIDRFCEAWAGLHDKRRMRAA